MSERMLNNLVDYIDLVPEERDFLRSEDKVFSYKQFSQLVNEFVSEYSYLKGKCCAVIAQSRLSLALYLPAIDSLVSTVLLQPPDLDDEITQRFYEKANVEFVIVIKNVNEVEVIKLNKASTLTKSPKSWLLATSGTTGVPKLVSFSLDRLISTAQKDISIGGNYNWGLCYDLNRFAGLQVYLQVIASGSTITVAEGENTINEVIDIFNKNYVNAISATPSFWRKALMVDVISQLKLSKITLGGEITTQNILDALNYKFPKCKITHIYASTEAGVGFSVKDGNAGFPANYLTESSVLSIQLKVVDSELWLKSSRCNNALLAGHIDLDNDGFINTGDIVECIDKRVFFLGRTSGAINIGGSKVMPEKIEAAINQNINVNYSRAYGKPNSMLGAIVCAEVVLKNSSKSLEHKNLKQDIITLCKSKLKSYEVPVLIKFVDSIAINSTGKLVRF